MKLSQIPELKDPWVQLFLILFAKELLRSLYYSFHFSIILIPHLVFAILIPILIGKIFYKSSGKKISMLYGLLGLVQVSGIGPILAFLIWKYRYRNKGNPISKIQPVIKRPLAFNVLWFFILWTVSSTIVGFFRTGGDKMIFEKYHLYFLSYVFAVISIVVGVGVLRLLYKPQKIGYPLTIFWLWFHIIASAAVPLFMLFDRSLLIEIYKIEAQHRGRNVENFIKFATSSVNITILIGTFLIVFAIFLYFFWQLKKHKKYFYSFEEYQRLKELTGQKLAG